MKKNQRIYSKISILLFWSLKLTVWSLNDYSFLFYFSIVRVYFLAWIKVLSDNLSSSIISPLSSANNFLKATRNLFLYRKTIFLMLLLLMKFCFIILVIQNIPKYFQIFFFDFVLNELTHQFEYTDLKLKKNVESRIHFYLFSFLFRTFFFCLSFLYLT